MVLFFISVVSFCKQTEKDCCLCSSFRYHAPCLIDLKTGELVELDLYAPHPTKVAELAEQQPQTGTLSFIRFADVTGTKLADSNVITLNIPVSEKTPKPELCRTCRKQLCDLFVSRYVLADLYDAVHKKLIPIPLDMSMELRCYKIFASKEENGVLKVTVQGTLH